MAILNNTEVVDQTSGINKIPSQPGLFSALGLYRGVTTGSDAVTFDVRDNNFHVLEDHLRNVAQQNTTEDRPYDVHTLAIPHYKIERTIGRERLAGLRAFNGSQEQSVSAAIAEELEQQARMHDLHEEFMLSQMTLSGVLNTNMYGSFDMAAEFNVSRPSETLDSTNPGDLLAALRSAQKKSKAGLTNGGQIGGFLLCASPGLFEWLIRSGDVTRAYELGLSSPNPLFNQLGNVANNYDSFNLGVTTVVLYDDSFTQQDGTTVSPLADDTGVLIPRTTLGRTFYGPESTMSGLGRGGARRFARSYMDPKDRFVEVLSEQNTLPVLEQFAATVDVTFTP